MDFSLNSSVVLAAIVGLWLVWVVPFFLNRSAPALAPALSITTTAGEQHPRGSIMDRTASTPAETPAEGAGPSVVAARPAALKIRRGRLAVALAGAAALPVALVTFVLALVSVVSFWWPVAAILAAGAAVAALRALAVRDRRARVDAAFAAAMSSQPVRSGTLQADAVRWTASSTGAAPVRTTLLFDAEEPEAVDAPAALTAAELKAAALSAAGAPAGTGDGAVVQGPAPAAGTVGTDPWEPVQVPLPTYVAAEKAERSAPAPLELPAEPKPTVRTPIKGSAAARPAPKDRAAAADAVPRINLDDVLQRRRA